MEKELIKLRPEDEKKIKKIIDAKEEILVAFPYGKEVFDQGWSNQPVTFNHLIITNKRVISLKKEWFQGEGEIQDFPFEVISAVELRDQVMGSTLLIRTETESENYEWTFRNSPKKEGETATAFLKKMMGKTLCLHCFKPVKAEFLFCPYCKNRLRNTCPSCGQSLEKDWAICPYCGGKGQNIGKEV